ncbi:MAG: GAF domain-containing protein [Bacteroidetes bacterium RIFCSPLOWO2_12_FULL_31_6]|nr:MAG: GAF domain-containing protein [Bacteroidetes bacterium RIFCSPLOWO2_12_FULL_31_6]
MAEELMISPHLSKEEKYKALIPQINALVMNENDLIANLSNIIAALKFGFNWLWVGVYFVKDEELVLGPFQGPVACTRIKKGKGVCGTSWLAKKTIIVKDVDQFQGHIACSSASKSEIVVPVFNKNAEVALVLDIDSEKINSFDEIDSDHLSQITKLIATLL